MLIDIGVNLADKRFHKDREAVIERARAAGVEAMILTGTSQSSSAAAAAMSETRPGLLFSTAGVHPHGAKHWTPDVEAAVRRLAARAGVVAIGECGLDHNRDFSPRPSQAAAFEAQLELAAELDLPVFLHERDAHEAFCAIWRNHQGRVPAGVVHCFTGTRAQAHAYLDLGLHIGVTGWICDDRRADDLRAAVVGLPLDRLMIETDAPYLVPRDLRPKPKGGRNEPAFLPHIAAAVARWSGHPLDALIAGTTATARAFFRLPSAG